jgi:raffinose/stachyose/melibiose transport system permease protein
MIQRLRRIGDSALALALVAVGLLPILWLALTSLKTQSEVLTSPFGLPSQPNVTSYSTVLSDQVFTTFALNSVVVTISSVFVVVVLSTVGAYGLARFDFRGNKTLFMAYLMGNAIPIFLILIPLFVLLTRAGLGGTTVSLILAYAAASMGISVLILRSYFRAIPSDIEDAARIDGCGTWGVLRHVMAPLVRPGIVVVAVFNAYNIWNEYFLAAFLLGSQSQFTLPPGLAAAFSNEYTTNWPGMAAGLVLSAVPLIILFALAYDRIVEGFSLSTK